MTFSVHIIGGSGFVGTALKEALEREGHRVTTSARAESSGQEATSNFFERIVSTYDWVVHAASCSTPASTALNPLLEIEGNLRATAALVEASQAHPHCRILYLSSAGTTYATSLLGHPREEDAQAPRSYHGAAKVAAEHFLQVLGNSFNCEVLIVRPSNVYGPGQVPRPGFGLVSTALTCCLDGKTMPVYGNGSSVRDYLFIDDFVELLIKMLSQPYQPGCRVYNAANGQGHSLKEVLDAVESVTGQKLIRDVKPARSVDPQCVVPDPTKARKEFCWSAETPLREGISRTFDWIKSRRASQWSEE